ncbi:1,4-dihydroxy-2-naphthoate polyprenyltransferase [Oceaniserpentilla sp. 4NH20-0058]|uniref:prenyltransferase n=1 Tax=Oceaniserpentilla sp. 4NH20-0058 TaxID=3127660 RepID=UPI0031050107
MDQLRIPKSSGELDVLLLTGEYQNTAGWVALSEHNQEVFFTQVKSDPPSWLYRWFKALRAISLTATIMPAIATVFLCLVLDAHIQWWVLVPALIAMVLLQISVNLLNDVEDYLKLIDLPDTLGGSGVIQSAWLTTKQIRNAGWGCFVLAGLLALPVFVVAPSIILLCALLAGIGVIGYSSKPFGFKYKALGDVWVFLLCGPVLTAGVSLAATGVIQPASLLLGCFFGLLAGTILNANNINDINVDKKAGAITIAGKLGLKNASVLQLLYYVGAFGALLMVATLIHLSLLLPLLALPLVIKHLKVLFLAQSSEDPNLNEIRFDAAKMHLLMSVLMCIGLLLTWGWF